MVVFDETKWLGSNLYFLDFSFCKDLYTFCCTKFLYIHTHGVLPPSHKKNDLVVYLFLLYAIPLKVEPPLFSVFFSIERTKLLK
ncbi:hypothetical protein Scep_022046 [Stephania cephalantha]|uniref:Uncharacterized protein n=1 Tax=Stephania cephalantha TaxID=152367 RepID=A0AAP0F797_9MAGN